MPVHKDIFRALHNRGAGYVWAGLTVAVVRGSPRFLCDLDFFIRPETVASGSAMAAEANIALADSFGDPNDGLMTRISGRASEEVWKDHPAREYAGTTVRVASFSHIVESRKTPNRETDGHALKRLKDELRWEIEESARRYRTGKKVNQSDPRFHCD
jgi:hypothetical protein